MIVGYWYVGTAIRNVSERPASRIHYLQLSICSPDIHELIEYQLPLLCLYEAAFDHRGRHLLLPMAQINETLR